MTAGNPGDWSPWAGGAAGTRARCVLAPNPSPMTLDGTNTWVLAEPGSTEAVVVDPGPLHEGHLTAVLDSVAAEDRRISVVLLTHHHIDHSEGARWLAERAGAPVRALDPEYRLGDEGLADGDVVAVGGLDLRVVGTPGHTSDSLSFLLPADGGLLTGDMVLGRGTTMVQHPDGRLDEYLDSLHRLADLAGSGRVARILPGHGPTLDEPVAVVEYYQRHRQERLDQVRAAVAGGAVTSWEVVERVYRDVDQSFWPVAELSVKAQLDYLADHP
jgi:glyoxylase-like metal-dependent hydrolase (beta-lactamase superfamily II)